MPTLFASLPYSMVLAGPVPAALSASPSAAPPDLTNTAAFDRTCASVLARARHRAGAPGLRGLHRRGTGAATRTFIGQGLKRHERERPLEADLALAIRQQRMQMREQLRRSRGMLEKIRLGSAKDGLLIAPATWVRDLNGDGEIGTSERYFDFIAR